MSYLCRLFSEEDGSPSFARIASGLIVLVVLLCIAFLVFTTGKLPDLGGAAAFVGSSLTTLYGVNKVSAIFNK